MADKVTQLINTKIEPIPRYELKSFVDDNKDFLVVEVGDGPKTPYYYVNEKNRTAYIRKGNESKEATKNILDNLILKGENVTYDELPSKYDLNDVSFTLLSASLKKETGKELNIDKDYTSMNLITNNKIITNAGILLCDQGLLSNSRIFCTRWNGIVKSGLTSDALDDKEYNGSIISLLENAELFIRNNSKISWEVVGMKRVEKAEYPLEAVREAIVNAIVHRDYQITGSEIHIDVYDNRLEITSPGGMLDGSNIQNLDITKISSMRRNRIISDIFNRLHYMDRRGSGLIRMIEAYNDSHIKPTFYSDTSSFIVSFPNRGYKIVEKNQILHEESIINGNVVSDEDYFIIKLYKTLKNVQNKTYEQILNLFSEFKYDIEFNRDAIMRILDIKASRTTEIISKLLDINLIEKVGPAKYKFKK